MDDVLDLSPKVKEKLPETKEKSSSLTFDIHSFDAIDSTSDHLKRLALKSAPEGTVITALSQTKGHGRYGREWVSPKGNFHLSLLLHPAEDIRALSQLSFVVAVALGRVIKNLLPAPEALQYKWPNDILINGRKAGGILLESSMSADGRKADWLIIGIGVNMVHYPKDMAATSLAEQNADVIPDPKMQQQVLKEFALLYHDWKRDGFKDIREEWLKDAAFFGKTIRVTTASESYEGVFEDLNKTGELILKLPDGKMRLVSTGEVFFTR